MSQQRPGDAAEAEVGRALRRASHAYGDLPEEVAGRLDRVLESLPAADTLHGATGPRREERRERPVGRWLDGLRSKRVRYAVLSATAAVLVTVGAVAAAVQFVGPGAGDTAASQMDDGGAAPEASEQSDTGELGAASGAEPNAEDPGLNADGFAGVATFATGADYDADADLLTALRGLGEDSATGAVPDALADLAAGGPFWLACEKAIVERFESMVVAVDFARFESAPALIVLLQSDSGESAVALTPACGDGVVETLAFQP